VRARAILTVLVPALVVACSGATGSIAPSAASPTQASAGPSRDPAPSQVAEVVVGGDRPVTVHVPSGYDPARPAPLLVLLHGYGSSGHEHDAYFHLGDAALQRGFLYIHPDGTRDGSGNRFWNATDACCDFDRAGVDDVGYLTGLITAIQATYAVDPKQISLIGHSNGGFMSYRLACVNADVVAAIVSLAGATFADPADCTPSAAIGVLEIHGTADDVIAYDGGALTELGSRSPMAPYPGAEATAAIWARKNGCGDRPSTLDDHVDVDADLGTGGSRAEASVARWTGCRPGGAVELWTIPGGGHAPAISDAFPSAVLDFLAAHPKP
jgi:polyhydroxybutyrate depolymerase